MPSIVTGRCDYPARASWVGDESHRLAKCETGKATKSYTTACHEPSAIRRETALEAAQFAKNKAKGDIIELRDCATGEKLVMLADGRVG